MLEPASGSESTRQRDVVLAPAPERPHLFSNVSGNGRAMFVARLRAMADQIEAHELHGGRIEWRRPSQFDVAPEEYDDAGAPVTRMRVVERFPDKVQYTELLIKEEG